MTETIKVICYTLLNILWFGAFFYAIFHHDWSPLSLIIPVCIHFTKGDLKFG